MKSFAKYKLPALAWAVIILWLSLTSGTGLPKVSIPYIDKAVHFTFYFVLTLLMCYAWGQGRHIPLPFLAMMSILIVAMSYGIAIEFMQEKFTTTRHFEWLDVAANSVGAMIGTLISVKLFK